MDSVLRKAEGINIWYKDFNSLRSRGFEIYKRQLHSSFWYLLTTYTSQNLRGSQINYCRTTKTSKNRDQLRNHEKKNISCTVVSKVPTTTYITHYKTDYYFHLLLIEFQIISPHLTYAWLDHNAIHNWILVNKFWFSIWVCGRRDISHPVLHITSKDKWSRKRLYAG